MKKIMILGASILQLPAIKKAQELGLQVIAVDKDPEAAGFKEPDVISENISSIDIDRILLSAKKHNIDGIMTLASDKPMRAVAAVAKELGLASISEQTALYTTDKGRMRSILKKHGVAVPVFFLVKTWEEFSSVLSNFTDHCIVKPADSSGSRGVTLLSISENSDRKFEAFMYSKEYSANGYILVEEYLLGPEVSVETFSIDGECRIIQVTDKITTGPPHFVEIGHSQPSLLSANDKERIGELAQSAVKATGIDSGPSHTEIILTNDGPQIVEIGARLGGGFIATHLVPLSTGIDLVEACIKLATNQSIDLEIKHNKGSAIRFLEPDIGLIKNIEGVKEAQKSRGVELVYVSRGIGEKSVTLKNGNDRVGCVIAQGNSAKEAIHNCENAKEKIRIIVE